MKRIKGRIVLICKVANDAYGNGHTHTEYIDDDEQLVLHHAAKGDQEIIFNHTGHLSKGIPYRFHNEQGQFASSVRMISAENERTRSNVDGWCVGKNFAVYQRNCP